MLQRLPAETSAISAPGSTRGTAQPRLAEGIAESPLGALVRIARRALQLPRARARPRIEQPRTWTSEVRLAGRDRCPGATLDCPAVAPGLEHTVRVQLRWRDMDMLGHLNQSVYHELLEEGRIALIADLMHRVGEDRPNGGYVVAHVDLDYHAEARKDHGEVEIVARVSHVGTSSIELEHEIRLPDGRLAASGKTVLVAWDLAARTKRSLSAAERAALS